MNKNKIIEAICQELERELNTFVDAALDARKAATHEEALAENKYDTRGLEASYLAGAQAKRAKEIADYLSQFKKMELKDFAMDSPINIGALVDIEVDGDEHKKFFIVPFEGGMKLQIGSEIILTLSPDSPLGKNLVGYKKGHFFEFVTKSQPKEYDILSVE